MMEQRLILITRNVNNASGSYGTLLELAYNPFF